MDGMNGAVAPDPRARHISGSTPQCPNKSPKTADHILGVHSLCLKLKINEGNDQIDGTGELLQRARPVAAYLAPRLCMGHSCHEMEESAMGKSRNHSTKGSKAGDGVFAGENRVEYICRNREKNADYIQAGGDFKGNTVP